VQPLRIRAFRRLPFVFGRIAKYPIPDEITDSWLEPVLSDRRIRENGRRFVRGIDYHDLPTAAERLREFRKPVLLLWAREERFFPFAFAERWMTVLPNARLVPVTDSYTYVAEDQPEFVSNQVATFAREVCALSGGEHQPPS
jgi:pimeloyl-ACP methyl ester carboxylesterase